MNKSIIHKIKICWVTPDWFVDVDFPIVPRLAQYYDITWIIVFPWRNCRYTEEEINRCQCEHLKIEYFHYKYFRKDPRIWFRYRKLGKFVFQESYDLYYINMPPGGGELQQVLYNKLPLDKTIVTAHDGSIKSIMSEKTAKAYSSFYPRCKYVQMYSHSQAQEMRKNYSGPAVIEIPLALKDYGKSEKKPANGITTFLSFGTIHIEKNIPLLIEAANQLYEEGIRNFKVSINGQWKISEPASKLIRHPEVVSVRGELIPNEDISDLYATCQFAVFPYKMMSQSGAVKVAMNYRKPVIVSDLPGFKDEVVDGKNGLFFHSEDIDSLKDVMRRCIKMSDAEYTELQKSTDDYIAENLSTESILAKYKSMIDRVLNNE